MTKQTTRVLAVVALGAAVLWYLNRRAQRARELAATKAAAAVMVAFY